MAPEVYEGHYDESIDIYAFGMCLLEMTTLEYPYMECDIVQIPYRVASGIKPESLDKVASKEIRQIIEGCTEFKIDKRYTIKDILDHPFFCGVKVNLVEAEPGVDSDNTMPADTVKLFLQLEEAKKRKDIHKENEGIQFDFNLGTDQPGKVTLELVRQGFVFDKDKKAVTKAIRECIAQVLLKRNAKDEPSGEDKKEKEKQDDDDEQAIKTEREDSDKEQHADESEKAMKQKENGQERALERVSGQEGADFADEVPPEILARGPLALEAYNKAIAEGRTCVKRVPVMLIGQDCSGKTSLKKSLMGKPFNPDEDSTVGIDANPSYFQVSTEVWKAGEKDNENDCEMSVSYERHAARLTVETLRQEKCTSKESISESTQTGEILQNDTDVAIGNNDFAPLSPSSDVPIASSHDTAKFFELLEEARSTVTSGVEPFTDPELSDNIPEVPEDIATLVEMLLQEVDEEEDEDNIYSVFWDFGGQSVYYTTHPLFLTSRAIFLLVNDLSRNPHDRAKSVMKQGMFTKSKDCFDFRTNLDYVDFWMSSVASLAIEDNSNQQGPKHEVLPEKLPPVFLVCTHADKPHGGGDPSTLANKVFGSLQTKPYRSHLYDDVFVVDNTKSGHECECSEVVRLREELLDVAKELPQMKQSIPIKWLRYEKALQVMKEDGYKWIPLDSAKQIASEVCGITDDKQFHTLLNFLHDQRILIHFDDTPELNRLVVLNPQWLIDVFKEVITIRPYHGKEKRFKKLWCKLEREGILEDKLLEHVWGPLFDSKETPESLIAIMEKFSLVCPLPSSDALCGKKYLVPSMLMSHPPGGIVELIKSAHLPSLFLKFESGHVPPGFFPRLVLQFFQWVRDECESPVAPQLYRNFARFYTSEEENCSVILLCHSFSTEVVVHRGNASHELADSLQSKLTLSADASQDTFDVTCARAVSRQLGLMLESMRNEFCWLKNMRYEVSFICPVCCEGGSVNYCRTHCAQGCKQEECLHFWSETQLCNTKSITCTKSAVAQNNRVPIEQFAPWLLPRRDQLTANEHDGSNTASAKASKEVALPGEVQESLLSQSCDAKEVVLQLGEMMQLDQASLEEPKPETKTVIRSLARKAKDSNRLDVFEHLREITPAGTTGPLLPENLDVRGIPHSKGRELTIDLCGGEDWKVVAEALGLTPQEIRFLDKRTLNPLDAALAFIAKQRHITVGDLYDVLNERGFPMLADLL
ncbi:hypothetical protein ACROYT_G027434 [Oculina patagonica]